MQDSYFYLTITNHGTTPYDAHKLKEDYDLKGFDAYNQGESDKYFGYMTYDKMCLRYPNSLSDDDNVEEMFHRKLVANLMKLPTDLTVTLHFASQADGQINYHFQEAVIRKLALINANVVCYGKFSLLPNQFAFAHTYIKNPLPPSRQENGTHFSVTSYQHRLDEIANLLGFESDENCSNYDDLRKRTNKPYYTTDFYYSSDRIVDKNESIEKHIQTLTDNLYLSKDKILRLGDDIDISYRFGITGHMPNPYQFTIDSDTLHKLAEMRMSVDIDMYFAGY